MKLSQKVRHHAFSDTQCSSLFFHF